MNLFKKGKFLKNLGLPEEDLNKISFVHKHSIIHI